MGSWIYPVILILLIGYGIWGRAVWKGGKGQGLKHFWDPAIRHTLALTGLSDRMGRFLGINDTARLMPWKRKEEAAADSICRAGSAFITGLAVFCALAGMSGIRQEEPDRSLVYRGADGWYVRKGEPGEPERILSLNGLMEEEEVTLQASAPNRPTRSLISFMAPIRSATSAMCMAYEGVATNTVLPKSRIRLIWRSVLPLEMGTTAAPIFSRP